jgi:hypothetical protein
MALHCSDASSAIRFPNVNSAQFRSRFHHHRSISSSSSSSSSSSPSFDCGGIRIHSRRRTLRRRFLPRASASPDPDIRDDGGKTEIRLNSFDLMALEFGRLLGESKEKTASKVGFFSCSQFLLLC